MNYFEKTRSQTKFQSAKDEIEKIQTLFDQVFNHPRMREVFKGLEFRDRLFPPLTTLWIFATQILSADHSCRAAVAQYLSSVKGKVCSLATGGYCQARKRLSETMLRTLVLLQAEQLRSRVPLHWLWQGRQVKLIDGTTVSMPDTEDNQRHFPATNKKHNPAEFPLARVVVVICKTSGVLLNAAFGSYQGKGTGETSLLKQLYESFKAGDIAVFDRCYSGFFSLAGLHNRQVDCVSRQHHLRKSQPIRRLGKGDNLICVDRPGRPKDMSEKEYEGYPHQVTLRLIKVTINQPGFRTRKIEVITTLMDNSAKEIAELYRNRWFVEVDLRSIKSVMGMNVLRCQTAEMIKKEIWMHFLTYNLVRTMIMDAASINKTEPRKVSFKAAVQLLSSFRISMVQATNKEWKALYFKMLEALRHQTAGHRPNRYEPRLKKRRPNDKYLKGTRKEARRACLSTKIERTKPPPKAAGLVS